MSNEKVKRESDDVSKKELLNITKIMLSYMVTQNELYCLLLDHVDETMNIMSDKSYNSSKKRQKIIKKQVKINEESRKDKNENIKKIDTIT